MVPFDVPLPIALTFLFILGTVVGSFLNVCIYRIPKHERLRDQLRGLWSPPSACPVCGTRIRPTDNLPIFGWMLLGGRCRHCRGRISIRYPLVELVNGLLWAGVYWLEVPGAAAGTLEQSASFSTLGPQLLTDWSPLAIANCRYVYHLVLFESLLVASLIDLDLRIIPDASTLPAMLFGVGAATALGNLYLVPVWFQDRSLQFSLGTLLPESLGWLTQGPPIPEWIGRNPHLHGLAASLAGLLVGGAVVWGVRIIGRWVLRQEAMGFGDVILMALIGSFIGWQPTLIVFFLAPVCALAVVAASWMFRRQREIPYGPYLSLATVIVVLRWREIDPFAQQIFHLGPLIPVMGVLMAVMLFVTLQFTQLMKRLLGIPLYEEEWVSDWRSADQLIFFEGENVDDQQGRWRHADRWAGIDAARGRAVEHIWRSGNRSGSSTAWHQHWQRNRKR